MTKRKPGKPEDRGASREPDAGDHISLAPPPPPTEPHRAGSLELDLGELRGHNTPVLELADHHVGPLSLRPNPLSSREPSVPPSLETRDALFAAVRDRHALGDFSGALGILETILTRDPTDVEASRYADLCRGILIDMYTSRLGSLERVPVVRVPEDQIRWLSLDHRAGFLLSLLDGRSTIEEVLDLSSMSRLDALVILSELKEQRVIDLLGAAD